MCTSSRLLFCTILVLGSVIVSDAGDTARFFREHANNLPVLLRAVAMGPYVVCTVFSLGYREFAANWWHAITHYGRVKRALLVAFDDHSLLECMKLGFACYNGSHLSVSSTAGDVPAGNTSLPDTFEHGSVAYNKLMWAKPLMIREVLRHNYNVLYTDMDTVWVKDALRSVVIAADRYEADMVGMDDGWHQVPNAGNLFIRNNVRTRRLMDMWLDTRFNQSKGATEDTASKVHDQDGLWTLKGKAWMACHYRPSVHHGPPDPPLGYCSEIKAQGMAALWLNPWHCCPLEYVAAADGYQCGFKEGYCSDEVAYLHMFCTSGGISVKVDVAKDMGLWFVANDTHHHRMSGIRASALIDNAYHMGMSSLAIKGMQVPGPRDFSPRNITTNGTFPPCARDIAWLGGRGPK